MKTVASRRRLLPSAAFCAAGIATVLAAFAPAESVAAQGARIPDFGSGIAAWDGIGPGDFAAVAGSPSPIGQDPRYERVANNEPRQPNYRIGDVSNPNLREWAREAMQRDNDEILAGKIAFSPRSTCHPGGVPGFDLMGGGDPSSLEPVPRLEEDCRRYLGR